MSPVSLAPETTEGLSAAPGPCAVQRRCWFSRSLCSLVQETDADRRTCVPRATVSVLSFCPVSRPDRVSAEPRKGTVRREGHRPQPGPSAVTRAPRPRPGIPVGLTPSPPDAVPRPGPRSRRNDGEQREQRRGQAMVPLLGRAQLWAFKPSSPDYLTTPVSERRNVPVTQRNSDQCPVSRVTRRHLNSGLEESLPLKNHPPPAS